MIKLNFWRRLALFAISLVGLFMSIGIPLVFLLNTIYSNIEIETVDKPKLTFSFVAAGLILVLILVYARWIKRVFHRKLNAMAVVNEIGMYSSKPIIWNRFLKTVEYVLPATMTLLFLLGLKTAFIGYPIFGHLYSLNIYFLILLVSGSVIFLIGDYIKVGFMNKQKIEDELKTEIKKDTLFLKRVKKGSAKEREALLIKRQLEQLQSEAESE